MAAFICISLSCPPGNIKLYWFVWNSLYLQIQEETSWRSHQCPLWKMRNIQHSCSSPLRNMDLWIKGGGTDIYLVLLMRKNELWRIFIYNIGTHFNLFISSIFIHTSPCVASFLCDRCEHYNFTWLCHSMITFFVNPSNNVKKINIVVYYWTKLSKMSPTPPSASSAWYLL